MLEIVVDVLIVLGLHRLLGKLDTGAWKSKLVVIILLGLASTLSLAMMAASMAAGVWGLGIPALAATLLFGFWTVRFLLSWLRKGREGTDSPLLDTELLPRADLSNQLTQEESLRDEMDHRSQSLGKQLW